jgi:hypothetical protein
MRWLGKIAVRRAGTVTAGLALALASLAVIPAAPAFASGSVVSWWTPPAGGSVYPSTYSCTAYQYGVQGRPVEVYNTCGTRVWLHYDDTATGRILAYCVNPNGGLAYGFNYPNADIQVTSNTSQCDAGATFSIWWQSTSSTYVEEDTYSCAGGGAVARTGYLIAAAYNGCDSRMWLHQYANGTGNGLCMNTGATTGPYSSQYLQAFVSGNQTGCDAGGPPYTP